MNRYREIFALQHTWTLVLASFPARIAYGMIGLGIFFKVQRETGSVALAGLAIGLNSIAGALTAGFRGYLIDRYGQSWPLRIFVPSYAAMILAVNASESKTFLLVMATIMGLTAPPINLSVRPLWKSIVSGTQLRTAYAIDTSIMNTAGVIGPVIATTLALSAHPGSALAVASAMMFIGGTWIMMSKVSRNWIPEVKDKGQQALWRNPALRLLMLEGSFIGFGWGIFDVAVPAFATLEKVPNRTAWVFAAMGIASIAGGLIAGTLSKRTSSLSALRKTYAVWFLVSVPIAFTYPGWSMVIAGAFLGFVGGAIQVFYWEVMEAVRPKGSATSYMGLLWTVEGTVMSLGAAIGGWLCETIGAQITLSITSVCIGLGYIFLLIGKPRLMAADRIPTEEEDLLAMEDNSPTTK
jgi:predicted MFS family arabinose efflux permease